MVRGSVKEPRLLAIRADPSAPSRDTGLESPDEQNTIAGLMRPFAMPCPARVAASVMLAALAIGPTVAAAQSDAAELLRAGYDAASEGEWEQAVLAAEQALGRSQPGPEHDGALLLRALCRYESGDAAGATADLTSISGPDALAGRTWLQEEAIGTEFLAWASERGVSLSVTARRSAPEAAAPLPEISLEDLNPAVAAQEVSSHFVMDVEIVRIPAIVTDERGHFITGLAVNEFSVIETDPLPQPVYQIIDDAEPTSLGILVDGSAAVAGEIEQVRGLLASMLSSLRAEDEVFVVRFDDRADFLSDFQAAGEIPAGAFADFGSGGRRALYDAVALGLIRMRGARNDKKALVLIAAGDDDGSRVSQEALRLAAQREGVAINVMMLSAGLSRWRPGEDAAAQPSHFVQQLAHQTGGLVALRPAVDARYGGLAGWLELAVGDLADYIKHQYLLLYESYDPPPRGEWRPLAVRVSRPHETIRARSGYVR